MQETNIKSYAKLNLTLDIIGKTEDGYHRIESIMHEIELHDIIQIKKLNENKLMLHCNVRELETPDNIAFKSAMLIKSRFDIKQGAVIKIIKNIPLGAGLGGGSSNASVVLRVLNELWNITCLSLCYAISHLKLALMCRFF